MTRPSQNIDKKLIQAGKELVPRMGISGLRLRDVARKAGVNLGMFNYHFGTKEKYMEVLMTEVYEEFFKGFKIESETGGTPLERLRNALLSAGIFVRENRMLVSALFEEIFKGNRKIVEFARKNMTKHVKIFLELLSQCQKEGYIVKTSIFAIVPLIIGAAALPSIVIRVLEKNYKGTFLGAFIPVLEKTAISDKRIAERIDLALKGISTGGAK
ncbi:MAG: TetR/AcrR family transcriptional regulator [Elusimicrobiota bacterium]